MAGLAVNHANRRSGKFKVSEWLKIEASQKRRKYFAAYQSVLIWNWLTGFAEEQKTKNFVYKLLQILLFLNEGNEDMRSLLYTLSRTKEVNQTIFDERKRMRFCILQYKWK